MSYIPPSTRSTGDLITASIWNGDIVANIVAMYGGAMGISSQALGDMIYAASASQLARLAMDASSGRPLASVGAGAPVWGGDMDWIGALLKNAQLQGYVQTAQALTIAAGVLTVDYKLGNLVTFPMNANITTMTLSNIPASGKFASLSFFMTPNGNPFTWAWLTSTVKWPNGFTPTLTQTNGKPDLYSAFTVDGGTTWYGIAAGQTYQ